MPGEIIGAIAQATTQSGWVDTPVLRSASETDAARFTDLLDEQKLAPPALSPTDEVAPTSATGPTSGNSLGDSILRFVNSAGSSYAEKNAQIEGVVNQAMNGQISVTELLRMQFQMLDTSLQVDLISKTVSKAVQDVDQMTKLQ